MTATSESNAASDSANLEKLTVGGGCFWCVEAVFETEPGVTSVVSGYAGGNKVNPTYKEVCTGTTGHAEVIQITYDPNKVSINTLLGLFWDAHDPTTPNRQGADVGTQYRSIILYENDAQRKAAEKSKTLAQEKFDRKIVTEIVPLEKFYPAEDYHQDYFAMNGHAPYCRAVIAPKLKKLGRDK
jgi:peptide-methionine (S)-S-oxide reductase